VELLKKLISVYGISGNEDEVRKLILDNIKPYVDSFYIDKMGNLITHKKGKGKKIMLAAHMDEIGLMVKRIDEDGSIHCSDIGGFEPMVFVGQRASVRVGKKEIFGVITTKEISSDHLVKDLPKISELIFDVGMSYKEIIKAGIEPGMYISLLQQPMIIGNNDIIVGKALDDRVGCYILIELAKRLKRTGADIYYVFTSQEEIGLYGAKTSTYIIQPDYAIAVDTTNANDLSEHPTKFIGHGPCLTIKDAEMLSNRNLFELLKKTAHKKNIPFQIEVSNFGTTDALSISLSRGGVPTTSLNVPIRNLHTSISLAHRNDIENAIILLEEFLKKPIK